MAMSYENFLFHQQNRAMAKPQAAHDNQEPEENWDCEEQGHQWKRLRGQASDGTTFSKCRGCGLEVEN